MLIGSSLKGEFIPILDPGHGMFYARSGGRYVDDVERHFYEGEFNRAVVNRTVEKCVINKIPCYVTTSGWEDMSLSERVVRANELYRRDERCYLLSIHSNAGGGRGFEVFTSPNQTESDQLATLLSKEIMGDSYLGQFNFRSDFSDGDIDKEAKFTILTDTKCPALLLEILFFDTKIERELLYESWFREKMAEVIFRFILKVRYAQSVLTM